MPRPKSLLVSMEITVAGKAHNCRFNKGHRIEKGVSRLTVNPDQHYCLPCARSFIAKDLQRLQSLLADVNRLLTA
ncbi:hypothetical protein D4S03_02260 [bacterium]|nr:MAG: hypothetical protein D4S03_02260 [bacterium]